jgi:hypothetical protein
MLREFFRSIGVGATGPAEKTSRMPKAEVSAIPPQRKGFGKRALTTPLIEKPTKI